MSSLLLVLKTWICSPLEPAAEFRAFDGRLCGSGIGRIDEDSNADGRGNEFAQQRKTLGDELIGKEIGSGCVASRSGKAVNETEFDRVIANRKNNGDG